VIIGVGIIYSTDNKEMTVNQIYLLNRISVT